MSKRIYVGVDTAALIPSGYTPVEYIESSGTQYIDTGFIPNQDSRVIIDCQVTNVLTTTDEAPFLFGSRKSSTANLFTVFVSSSTKFGAYYGGSTRETQYFTTAIAPTERHIIDYNKDVLKCESETLTFTPQTFATPVNMYIFACNNGGTVFRLTSMKLYTCQIYDNGTIVRDFVPCKNSSGTFGLYDVIGQTFYSNAGTGSFTGGTTITTQGLSRKVKKLYLGNTNSIAQKIKKGYIGATNFENRGLPSGYTQIEYIQSSGTQYIDTGFTAKNTTKIVADCEITYGSGWIMILGSYDSSAYFSWWAQGTNLRPYFASSNKTIAGPSGRMTLVADGNIWSANDTSSSFTSSTFTATSSAYLFSVNNGGNYTNATMKLYSCQIYDNGTLVRDFIPCKNSSGVAGLYDLVNSKFYTNAGTGNFTTGSELKEVAKLFYTSQFDSDISVSPNSITIIGSGSTASATLTYIGEGAITAIPSDTSICSAEISGNTVIITGIKSGTTTITIKIEETDNYSEDSCIITVTVKVVVLSQYSKGLSFSKNRTHYGTSGTLDNKAFFIQGQDSGGINTDTDVFNSSLTRTTINGPRAINSSCASSCHAANTTNYLISLHLSDAGSHNGTFYYNSSNTLVDVTSQVTTISKNWYSPCAGSIGGNAIFAGGKRQYGTAYTVNYVYCISNSMTLSALDTLYKDRQNIESFNIGNYLAFAGGYSYTSSDYTNIVDVFDSSLTTSIKYLPSKGSFYAAAMDNYAILSPANSRITYSCNTSLTFSTITSATYIIDGKSGGGLNNYVIFAGGNNDDIGDMNGYTTYAESYNYALTLSTAPELRYKGSESRVAKAGKYLLFGGGYYGTGTHSTVTGYYES